MKIILCSAHTTIRERWYSVLAGKEYSLYLAASPQMLQPMLRKGEEYLLLLHSTFAEPGHISALCQNRMCKVFILSDSPSAREGMLYLQAGTVGYANTYIAQNRLVEAIRTIVEGGTWFEYQILSKFIQALSSTQQDRPGRVDTLPETLSQREKEIAVLISQGCTNQAIAEKLFISERTVKAHLGTIFNKTGTQNRLQLALLVLNVKH